MKKSELKEQIRQGLLKEVGLGLQGYSGGRSPQNSVKQIVDYLKNNPFSSESQLQKGAFDYDRSETWESNKKYADMLRRGMAKGIIARTEAKVEGNKSKWFYFVPASSGSGNDFVYKPEMEENLNEEAYDTIRDVKSALGSRASQSEVEDYLGRKLNSEEMQGFGFNRRRQQESKKIKINKKF